LFGGAKPSLTLAIDWQDVVYRKLETIPEMPRPPASDRKLDNMHRNRTWFPGRPSASEPLITHRSVNAARIGIHKTQGICFSHRIRLHTRREVDHSHIQRTSICIQIDEAFKNADKNGDGKLSKDELPSGLFLKLDSNRDIARPSTIIELAWRLPCIPQVSDKTGGRRLGGIDRTQASIGVNHASQGGAREFVPDWRP